MAWPAMSPDMNCIEHLWDILGRRIDHHGPSVQTRGHLIAVLQYHWNNIPQQEIRRLVMSMPRRLQHCLAANGISEGNDQTAERGTATGVGHSSLDRDHPTAMKDCCA
nr:hypothetical protein BaRGS_000945 [Batillaria attramentaria]